MRFNDYNEKRQHGSVDFPIQYYRVDETHPRYVMPLHWHDEFELIRIISGRLTVYLNNVVYELCAGDVLAVNCRVLHRGEPENCVYECVVFDLNMLRKNTNDAVNDCLLPLISGEKVVNSCYNSEEGEIYRAVCELFSALREQKPFYELYVHSLLFLTVSAIYTGGYINNAEKKKRVPSDTVQELVEWIDAHFDERITLKQLAGFAHMNEKYLCRLFREYTGRTPIEYINFLRIEKAAEAIISGSSVTEAAMENGFNDLSYFSKTFKKYTGLTPKEYLKKQKNR